MILDERSEAVAFVAISTAYPSAANHKVPIKANSAFPTYARMVRSEGSRICCGIKRLERSIKP
jgi:hypothetical protein